MEILWTFLGVLIGVAIYVGILWVVDRIGDWIMSRWVWRRWDAASLDEEYPWADAASWSPDKESPDKDK